MNEEEALQAETERFQGDWVQIAYERDGVEDPIDDEEGWKPRTTFKDNTFVVTVADGTIPIAGVFKIDPSKDPKHIEYTDTLGQYAGETYSGIYRLDGETLVFCVGDHLGDRPTEFKARQGEVMRTLLRVPNPGSTSDRG